MSLPDPLHRGFRALRYSWWAARSWIVLSWYRLLYPGLRVGRGVRLGRGVDISVVRGASLDVGDRVQIDSHVRLTAEGDLAIGPDSYVGVGSIIVSANRVTIGRDALIAAYVTIRDQDHRIEARPFREQSLISVPVEIGDNVWLGTKVTVLRGVEIGSNCVIGANSVVTRPIPCDCVAVGTPARIVKRLSDGS